MPAHRITEADYWTRVDVRGPDDCWLWQGASSGGGYGAANWANRQERAHRLACGLTCCWPTPDVQVNHLREGRYAPGDLTYRRCCNPAHLYFGDHVQNMADRTRSGRVASGARNGHATVPSHTRRGAVHWTRRLPERLARGRRSGAYTQPERLPRGEAHGLARLSPSRVQDIRRRYAAGEGSVALGEVFGVSGTTILQVHWGRTWRHVPNPDGSPYLPAQRPHR